MPNHWALKDYEISQTADGLIIVATTWQLCHLWLRWSLIVPKEHIIPSYLRGIFLHADKYFCFDAYHDNEQEEDGDTLEHTFIKEPWPGCETRYFYFHGVIDGKSSPSTTAIFSKHREVGFIFREEYTLDEWLPAWLFKDEYTVILDETKLTLIFTEIYWTP